MRKAHDEPYHAMREAELEVRAMKEARLLCGLLEQVMTNTQAWSRCAPKWIRSSSESASTPLSTVLGRWANCVSLLALTAGLQLSENKYQKGTVDQ